MAGKKKRKALTSKQLLMICVVLVCFCNLMLLASILLNSASQQEKTVQAAIEKTQETMKEAAQPAPEEQKTPAAAEPASGKKTETPQTITINVSAAETAVKDNAAKDEKAEKTSSVSQKEEPAASKPTAAGKELLPDAPVTKNGAKLVFVFDDAGHNLKQLEPILKLPFPVAVAVLPGLAHSADAAAASRKAGVQTLLHQPMQAINLNTDPGPGAIKPDMHTYEVEEIVRKNLAEVGPVAGINNHEGSLITATKSLIGAVLDVCQEEDIFFLDSRTNSETKAPQAALERGMSIYERDIFLDNTQNREDIIAMVSKGMTIAAKKGHAILIGHVWSDGLAGILEELYPEIVAKGYVFTDLSGL